MTDAKSFSHFKFICKRDESQHFSEKSVEPNICEGCKKRDFSAPILLKYELSVPQEKENGDELLRILKDPVQRFLKENKLLFADELESSKAIFLVCCLQFVRNHYPASSNLLINAQSGVGKDFIMEKILGAFDPNYVIIKSRISPTVLNYWHNAKDEPYWTWDGKILCLADVSNAVLNCAAFKCHSSGQNSISITEKGKVIDIEVNGKPVLLLTAAFPNQSHELLRRFPIASLSDTEFQTKQVKSFQAREAKGENSQKTYSFEFREAINYLKPVNVIIPFADAVDQIFPNSLNARTGFPRFLDYIKASASLHQYFRGKDLNENILATLEDYALAREIFLYTTSNSSLIPLNVQQKVALDFFSKNQESTFSFNELHTREAFQIIPERSLRRILERLQEFGMITSEPKQVEYSIRPVQFYKFKNFTGLNLPTKEELIKVLDTTGTTTQQSRNEDNEVADKAEQAERVEINDSIQSAKSAHSASEIQLQNFDFENEVDKESYIQSLVQQGISKETVEESIRSLKRVGRIFEPRKGILKLSKRV